MSSKQKRPFRYLHREWPVEWPAIVTISIQLTIVHGWKWIARARPDEMDDMTTLNDGSTIMHPVTSRRWCNWRRSRRYRVAWVELRGDRGDCLCCYRWHVSSVGVIVLTAMYTMCSGWIQFRDWWRITDHCWPLRNWLSACWYNVIMSSVCDCDLFALINH